MHFITVSRQLGAKGTDIAKLVAKELQYHFYDTADIETKARELGFLNDIREIDDKPPSLFKQIFSRQPGAWLEHLYRAIYDLSRQGNAVIIGRGGNILFRPIPQALHVRVIASQETRIKNLLESGYQREDAVMCMEKSDYERSTFFWFAFQKDWHDPMLYDLALNTDNLSVEAATDTILGAARFREYEYGCRGVSSLGLLELAARVSVALTKSGFPTGCVSPSVTEPGKVRLTGIVQSPREKLAAELTVSQVAGVDSVENEIAVAGR